MKKTLLIATSLLLAMSASALSITPVRSEQTMKNNAGNILRPGHDLQKAPVKRGPTADGYDIQFCGDIDTWYYVVQQNKVTYECFVYITPEIASALAGNQLTEISFSSYLTSADQKRNGEVFVHEVVEGEIDYESGVTQSVTVIDANRTTTDGYQVAALDNPYVIKDNTGFIFGYTVKSCLYSALTGKADYPIGVDAGPAGSFSGMVYVYDKNNEFLGYVDMEQVNCNLFLKAKTVGPMKSVENVFNVQGAILDYFTLPIMVAGDGEQVAYIGIDNFGTNPLTTVKYTATVPGGASLSNTADINVPAGDSKLVGVPLPDLGVGRNTLNLNIEAVNGVPVGRTANLPYLSLDNQGFDRKFVVEEGTGDWCGWCPRGIVGFEYMEENYPDAFVGIAAHYDDDMAVASYEPVIQKYFSGFPSCVINRDLYWADTDPSDEELEFSYESWSDQRSPVKVGLSASYDPETKTIEAVADAEFALSCDGRDYSVAFALLQNDIPGVQTNYYAGGNYGECGGWETKGNPVAWLYQHVARDLVSGASFPATVTQGEKYQVKSSIPTTNVNVINGMTDENKTAVVAMVIDNGTGTVLNAAEVKAADYGTSSVKDVIATAASIRAGKGMIQIQGEYGDAAVYTVSGTQVANIEGGSVKVPAGLYIVRVDGRATKVVVR